MHDVEQPGGARERGHGFDIDDIQDNARRNAPNDVIILQLLEQTDLPDGRAWHTFVLSFEPNLLQGHNLAGVVVLGLVYDTICS